MEEATINLFSRYEQRLLSGGLTKPQAIPAVVITGFLGSGKTTLLQHILRNRGSLRVAVLVNEVGQVDLDSHLINAKQSNAAVGLPAADLSGGCICCAKSEDLKAALHHIVTSAAPDYLVVETSGAADAGPLASLLAPSHGFRLDAVVAVVDAEAGPDALQHPVAQAQVQSADVIVLNKCDLAPGLGAVSELEDRLHAMAPGARVLRARFCEVPLPAVMDVEPADEQQPGGSSGREQQASSSGGSSSAEASAAMALMSHESVPSGRGAAGYRVGGAPGAGGLVPGTGQRLQCRQQPAAVGHAHAHAHAPGHVRDHAHGDQGNERGSAGGCGGDGGHAHDDVHAHAHPHSVLHQGFHTEALDVERPCSLAPLLAFVQQRLLRAEGLFRCKGVLWVRERRRQRFVLHLSGRRRVELLQAGAWEGPPHTQLVLIGADPAALRQLQGEFLEQVVAAEAAGQGPAAVAAHAQWQHMDATAADACAASGALEAVAARMAAHERLRVMTVTAEEQAAADQLATTGVAAAPSSPCPASPGPATVGSAGPGSSADGGVGVNAGGGGGLVEWSVVGSPLHGISGEELNADLMLRANAGGEVLLVSVTAPGTFSATTQLQPRDRVVSLLLHVPRGSAADGEALWAALQRPMEPLLRKAFQHAHNCKCDVAGIARGMAT